MIKKVSELIKKYEMFIKYIFVAGISFVIDIVFFSIFKFIFVGNIIIATILARIISSFINYLLNKDKVFKSNEKSSKTIIKYYALVVIQMLVSAFAVDNLYKLLSINATLIKVPVEFILFICNYLIQKILIFKRGKNENN
ncbi:MAG: GtrA family protein [Bacilli bacterium]|nr:GtrA family protein [Bacilli bacterium]MBQ8901528.1 GtrA family protein [Bacilli bacterium]